MKKLVSLFCSMALLLAVCVPAYAADDPISSDSFLGSVTIGDYTYSLSQEAKGLIAAYMLDLQSKEEIKDDISAANLTHPSSPDQLWTAVSTAKNYESVKSSLGITGVSFHYPTVTVTDKLGVGGLTFNISSSYNGKKDDNDDSGSTPSSGTTTTPTDNSQTTVTPGANGATTVGVTTAPDTTPSVSGGTASVVATVPSSAISTAVAGATAGKPASIVISTPSAALVGQLNSAAVQSVSMTMKVPSEIAYGTVSNVGVAMNLDSSVLKAAGQTGKNITVGVVDQMTGKEAYSWTFKGSDLAAAGSVASVNMALNVSTSTLDSQVSGKVPSSEKGVVLSFGNNGTLPAPATVKVLVSNQGYKPGQQIHMYYFNSQTNQVEALANSTYTVDADGYASVVIDHCSKYILSSGVIAAVQPVRLDTGKKISVKAGKTYQFKVTASAKPAFTSGNSAVFKVSANGSKGNDYFFKVTAVGKAGQSTGFYVNGEKTPRTVGTIVA